MVRQPQWSANLEIAEPRALIVSGDARCLLSLSAIFHEFGFTFKRNTTGADVIQQLCAMHPLPNIILIDLSLPDGDPYSICRAIRHDPSLSDIPIVALYDEIQRIPADELRRAGFAGYFHKPLARGVIADKLPSLLDGISMWESRV
jgi:CheY-like chemotaxis protein